MLKKMFDEIFPKEHIEFKEKAENLVYRIKDCKVEDFRDAYYRFLIEKPDLVICSVIQIADENGYTNGHMLFVNKNKQTRIEEEIKTVHFTRKENHLNELIPNYLYYFIANPFENLPLLYENFSLKNPELELLSVTRKHGNGYYIFTKPKKMR